MSQNPTTHVNEKKRPIVYPKGMKKYIGVMERGAVYSMGADLPLLRFGDLPGTKKFIKILHLDKEEDRKMWEAVQESKPYKTGKIIYIKSPEEVQAEAKKKKQEETLASIKKAMDEGFLTITDMNVMPADKVKEMADSIGAETEYFDTKRKVTKTLRKELLIRNIKLKLGVSLTNKETEIGKEIASANKEKENGLGK